MVVKNIKNKGHKPLNNNPSKRKDIDNKQPQDDLKLVYEDIFDIHEINSISKKKNKNSKSLNIKCDFKLCNMALCILGKNLILSGVLMQEKLSNLLASETNKINAVVDKFKVSSFENVSVKDLVELNSSIRDTICCIADIEDKIITKIEIGEKLLHEPDPCPPHCDQEPEQNCNDDDDDDDDD